MRHCWEEGPNICKAHGVDCDDLMCDTVGSSCMEESGHEGAHIFVSDNEIMITFEAIN